MKYGVCIKGQTAVRAEHTESSELVTQMLFGETCKIIDQKSDWYFVYTDTDQYLGWIDIKCIHSINHDDYQKINERAHPVLSTPFGIIETGNKKVMISQGSTLPYFDGKEGQIGRHKYQLTQGNAEKNKTAADYALDLLGAPYLWGGRTILGIDCSALVLNTFKIEDFLLPRDASEQVSYGETVAFMNEAKKGDVCFFDKPDGKITHTGILLDNKNIIHASGEVRIDSIDHQGIYNQELKKYTHHLRVIRRLKKRDD